MYSLSHQPHFGAVHIPNSQAILELPATGSAVEAVVYKSFDKGRLVLGMSRNDEDAFVRTLRSKRIQHERIPDSELQFRPARTSVEKFRAQKQPQFGAVFVANDQIKKLESAPFSGEVANANRFENLSPGTVFQFTNGAEDRFTQTLKSQGIQHTVIADTDLKPRS